jgi:ribose transport system ATP-binding protein
MHDIATRSPRLLMRDVRKRFGATVALDGAHLALAAGEVHALIGENGAGKSTLMNILSGAISRDGGTIELDGRPFDPKNPLQVRRSGIAMIYQELNLAPDLSVEENLLLGEEPERFGWVRRAERRRLAQLALARVQRDDIPLDAPVRTLPLAMQQMVEIARACMGEPRVIVMDEPTSSLSRSDVERLFRVIRNIRERGVGVVYISHFLEECREVAGQFTVLRDGRTVGAGEFNGTSDAQIMGLMVGRAVTEIFPHVPHAIGEPVLQVRHMSGDRKPRDVQFSLRKGEILGLAGLVGAGRSETLRVLFGLDRCRSGSVEIRGRRLARTRPHRLWAAGVGMVSENRKEEGLLMGRNLADNLTLSRLDRYAGHGWLSTPRQHAAAARWLGALNVKFRSTRQPMRELSGGNQQKIAVGRLLHHEAEIFLLDEPTRGIDIVSKVEIYRLMGELAAQGRAILFVSSYLPELLGMCDTIGVMRRGELIEVRPAREWNEHSLLAAAIGAGSATQNT